MKIFGIVKSFDCERGYGFIKRADAGDDVIVHTSGFENGQSLKKGTNVVFNITHTPKVSHHDRFKNRLGGQRLSVASHVKQLETVSGRVKHFEFNVVASRKGAKAENVTQKLETRAWSRAEQRKHYLAEVVSGRVKCFDAEHGYGFIVRDDTHEDVFVHKSEVFISGPLNAGDQVKFNVVHGQKGPEASCVTQKLETTEDRGRRKHYLAKNVSGKVKRFDAERGFGFIIRDDTNEDLFVHKSAIEMSGPLNPGDEVEFNVVLGRKGPMASYVTPSLGGGRGSNREFPLEEWLLDGEEGSNGDDNHGRATPDPEQLCCGASAKCVLVDDDRVGSSWVKSVCGLCVETKEEAQKSAARDEEEKFSKEEKALEEKFNMLLKGKNKLVTGNSKVRSRKDSGKK